MSERREKLHEEIEEEYKSYANELQRFIQNTQTLSDYLRDDDLHGARYWLEVIQAQVEDALSLIHEMWCLKERLQNREA